MKRQWLDDTDSMALHKRRERVSWACTDVLGCRGQAASNDVELKKLTADATMEARLWSR